MLKPMDIHNKEFKKAMRGYDAEEVDEFLDEIIVDFEKMQRELDVLKKQLAESIASQEYEKCAELRDSIRALEEGRHDGE